MRPTDALSERRVFRWLGKEKFDKPCAGGVVADIAIPAVDQMVPHQALVRPRSVQDPIGFLGHPEERRRFVLAVLIP